jgi:hypothetical protein
MKDALAPSSSTMTDALMAAGDVPSGPSKKSPAAAGLGLRNSATLRYKRLGVSLARPFCGGRRGENPARACHLEGQVGSRELSLLGWSLALDEGSLGNTWAGTHLRQ